MTDCTMYNIDTGEIQMKVTPDTRKVMLDVRKAIKSSISIK